MNNKDHHNNDGLLYKRGLTPEENRLCMEMIDKDEIYSQNMPTTNDDIIINQKMYYDKYDKEDGIGFYPNLNNILDSTIYMNFKLFIYKLNVFGWIQYSGPVIYGLLKRDGIELLNILNATAKQDAMVISNSGGRIIYPMMYNSTYYILENYSK